MSDKVWDPEQVMCCGVTAEGERRPVPFRIEKTAEGFRVTVDKTAELSAYGTLEADIHGVLAEKEDEGYLVLPRGSATAEYALMYFEAHRADFSASSDGSNMPVYGAKTKDGAFLAVVSGMSWDYALKVERKDGKLKAVPAVRLPLYEDLVIEVFFLAEKDADYCGMARRYRRYQEEHTGMRKITDRIAEYPAADYAAQSPLIRIRCGWKPAPAEVMHQTRENEPEMHVACTFARIGEFLDAMKAAGIGKADVCLVGWNKSGHDGRWPETFPVEPLLGGEAGLRALADHAHALGYSLTCHTNHTDQYEIADCYSADNTRVMYNGKPAANAVWSGGQMFDICPKIGLAQAKALFPKVAALGLTGVHYVDVLGVVMPKECLHPAHPVTRREACGYAREMAEAARECFGGFSSEGTYDFLAPYLDYGLYVRFVHRQGVLCDEPVPFWELVYHGYVLSNPYADTVNAVYKEKKMLLHAIEYGGRPTFYVYSAFMSNGKNWMTNANIDPVLDTDADMERTVNGIRESWELWQTLGRLAYETMDAHRKVSDGVYETVYSDGTVVRTDYNTETFAVSKQ